MQAAWLMFEDRWLDCRIVVVRMEQWWIGELIGSGLRCGVCVLLRWRRFDEVLIISRIRVQGQLRPPPIPNHGDAGG